MKPRHGFPKMIFFISLADSFCFSEPNTANSVIAPVVSEPWRTVDMSLTCDDLSFYEFYVYL